MGEDEENCPFENERVLLGHRAFYKSKLGKAKSFKNSIICEVLWIICSPIFPRFQSWEKVGRKSGKSWEQNRRST